MAISQAELATIAADAEAMYGDGLETVTYRSRTTMSAIPVAYPGIVGHAEDYTDQQRAMANTAGESPSVDREDQRFRMATSRVLWTPTTNDSLVRADGSEWRVLAIPQAYQNRIWYVPQIRRIKP